MRWVPFWLGGRETFIEDILISKRKRWATRLRRPHLVKVSRSGRVEARYVAVEFSRRVVGV